MPNVKEIITRSSFIHLIVSHFVSHFLVFFKAIKIKKALGFVTRILHSCNSGEDVTLFFAPAY